MFEHTFKVPKHNIKKLGKAFDLDTMETSVYTVILLSSVTGLSLETLDKFDTNMEVLEATNYNRTNIPLQVSETITGYNIGVSGGVVTIDITGLTTIAGILIINNTTKDILCADITSAPIVNIESDLNLFFSTPLWQIGESVCDAQ